MHFSTSATSVLHIDPSIGGIFTMRSRLLMPKPQVTLQGSHSAHSVTTQLLGAAEKYAAPKTHLVGLPMFRHEDVQFLEYCCTPRA